MRLPSSVDLVVEGAQRVGAYGLLVRGLIAVASAGCWAVAGSVGHVNALATVVLVLVVMAAAARPDSGAPLAVIVALVGMWIAEAGQAAVEWSVVLGIGVLVVHVSAARAAAMGDGARIGGAVARRWLVQSAVVAAATAVLWALVVMLDRAAVSGRLVVSAIALAVVAAFAVVAGWVSGGDQSR
jgi:hypothetical protein